jgi:hypothetical protein
MDFWDWVFPLVIFYAIGGFFAAGAYPYVKTGQAEEAVLGIERVGAFIFWWLVLPAAAIRFVWDIIKAVVE